MCRALADDAYRDCLDSDWGHCYEYFYTTYDDCVRDYCRERQEPPIDEPRLPPPQEGPCAGGAWPDPDTGECPDTTPASPTCKTGEHPDSQTGKCVPDDPTTDPCNNQVTGEAFSASAVGRSVRPKQCKKEPAANKSCNATEAVSFIHAHQADAATIANQLGLPTENVLGLSGIESNWGASNAAKKANNFFGLHYKRNDPFATPGIWYTEEGVAMSLFPSYLASGQSFAARYGGVVQGVRDPTAFAQALQDAGFNPGKPPFGSATFVPDTAGTISGTARRMQCP